MSHTQNKFTLIIATILFGLIGTLIQDPIAQDGNYHLFKDSRDIWSIPNFWNVVSNVPFLIVGILGLYKIIITNELRIIDNIKVAYILFFLGITFIAFGSSYYHLSPNNETLVWDRLPMTIAFMSLFAMIIGEFISIRSSKILLVPLLLAGISSVVFWYYSEGWGEGDLRYYILVQFLPLLIIPIILVSFQSRYTCVIAYWGLLAAYFIAKLLEYFDGEVFKVLSFISGHSIKHLAAALGLYILLFFYERRNCN